MIAVKQSNDNLTVNYYHYQ